MKHIGNFKPEGVFSFTKVQVFQTEEGFFYWYHEPGTEYGTSSYGKSKIYPSIEKLEKAIEEDYPNASVAF